MPPKRLTWKLLWRKGLRHVRRVRRFVWGSIGHQEVAVAVRSIIFLLFVFRPRSKTSASSASRASKPYRIRVSREALCLPKCHTCHTSATRSTHQQTEPAHPSSRLQSSRIHCGHCNCCLATATLLPSLLKALLSEVIMGTLQYH